MSLATATNLDKAPATLARALQEVVKGEVFCDPFTRSMYATDASIYEVEPLVVVYPLDELDVRGCLWFGQKHGVPVTARVCVMDGTVTLANPVKLDGTEYENKKKEEGLSGKIHRELPELLKKNAALIASKVLKTQRNRAGYALDGVIAGEIYDLPKLI